MTNETKATAAELAEWLQADSDFQEHQRDHYIAVVPAAEDATMLRAAAAELTRLAEENAWLRIDLGWIESFGSMLPTSVLNRASSALASTAAKESKP
jgi:hypothetical protein